MYDKQVRFSTTATYAFSVNFRNHFTLPNLITFFSVNMIVELSRFVVRTYSTPYITCLQVCQKTIKRVLIWELQNRCDSSTSLDPGYNKIVISQKVFQGQGLIIPIFPLELIVNFYNVGASDLKFTVSLDVIFDPPLRIGS